MKDFFFTLKSTFLEIIIPILFFPMIIPPYFLDAVSAVLRAAAAVAALFFWYSAIPCDTAPPLSFNKFFMNMSFIRGISARYETMSTLELSH